MSKPSVVLFVYACAPACRYQLRVCVEACKHRLLTIDNRSISWNTALAMLHLPPGLQEGDAFAALTEVRQRGGAAGHTAGSGAAAAAAEPLVNASAVATLTLPG